MHFSGSAMTLLSRGSLRTGPAPGKRFDATSVAIASTVPVAAVAIFARECRWAARLADQAAARTLSGRAALGVVAAAPVGASAAPGVRRTAATRLVRTADRCALAAASSVWPEGIDRATGGPALATTTDATTVRTATSSWRATIHIGTGRAAQVSRIATRAPGPGGTGELAVARWGRWHDRDHWWRSSGGRPRRGRCTGASRGALQEIGALLLLGYRQRLPAEAQGDLLLFLFRAGLLQCA